MSFISYLPAGFPFKNFAALIAFATAATPTAPRIAPLTAFFKTIFLSHIKNEIIYYIKNLRFAHALSLLLLRSAIINIIMGIDAAVTANEIRSCNLLLQ